LGNLIAPCPLSSTRWAVQIDRVERALLAEPVHGNPEQREFSRHHLPFLHGDTMPTMKKQADGVQWVSWMEDVLYVLGDIIRGRFNFKEWKASLPHGRDVLFGWKDPLPVFIIPLNLFETYFNNRVKFKKLLSHNNQI
jgi:hypothetical protein